MCAFIFTEYNTLTSVFLLYNSDILCCVPWCYKHYYVILCMQMATSPVATVLANNFAKNTHNSSSQSISRQTSDVHQASYGDGANDLTMLHLGNKGVMITLCINQKLQAT